MHRVASFCTLLILLVSCPCIAYDGELYRNDQYSFSIKMPKGWTIEKGRNPHVVVKALNDARTASVAVTVQALSSQELGRRITDLVTGESIVEGYRQNGAKAVLLDSGLTKIWNEQAVWVNILLSVSHLGKTAHTIQYQVVTFHRGYMYSLLVGAGSDNQPDALTRFERFEPLFQAVLSSFAFEDWRRPDSDKTPMTPQKSLDSGRAPLWPGPIENFMPKPQPSPVQPETPAETSTIPISEAEKKLREREEALATLELMDKVIAEQEKREREEELINDCLLRYQKNAQCKRSAQIINWACTCISRELVDGHDACPDMTRSACKCVLSNISDAQTDVAANMILKACRGKNK